MLILPTNTITMSIKKPQQPSPARVPVARSRQSPAARDFAPEPPVPAPAPPPSVAFHDFAELATPSVAAQAGPTQIQAKIATPGKVAQRVLKPSGGGRALPDPVREKMQSSFGQDFSNVRVHEGQEAPSIGAVAYTRGSNIHFAPGKYQPSSASGQKLLGHELTHVVQQRQGRVRAPAGGGVPINSDAGLEREADVLGSKAAGGR